MGIRRRQVAVALFVVGAALVYLVFAGMNNTMVFYYTVDELLGEEDLAGKPLRVSGRVVPGSIEQRDDDRLWRRFRIADSGPELTVVYDGDDVPPDTLVDDAEAVAEGRLGDDGVFHAQQVLAKCPSKYEAETDYEAYRERGVVAPAAE